MLGRQSDYDRLYRDFVWQVPPRYNIAVDACDRHADGSGRLALIYVTEAGSATEFSFDYFRHQSNRFSNVLKEHGLRRGDRLAILLPQTPETAIAHLAAFKSGMISVPLFTLFGEEALRFRLSDSGARAIVTDAAGAEKLEAMRQ